MSEHERTLASFPLLISSRTGILSHPSVVNWKRPPWRRGVPISVSFSVVPAALWTPLIPQSISTPWLWHGAHLSSPGSFLTRAPQKGATKASPFLLTPGQVPCAPQGLVWWGCSSCSSRASPGASWTASITSAHGHRGAWGLKTRAPQEPSPSVTPHLFRCDLAEGAMLMSDPKDSKISVESSWMGCYWFLIRKGWSNPSAGGSEGDTTAQGLSRSAPLNISSVEWQWCSRKCFPWSRWEQSLCLGTPQATQNTNYRDGLSADSISGEAPFPRPQGVTGHRVSLQRGAVVSLLTFWASWTSQSWVQGHDSHAKEIQWGIFESSDF